jgi:hypothetical protein
LPLGVVAPVEHALALHLAEPERDGKVRMAIAAARLDDTDARVLVFGQAVGEHAAGGAGSDDDVIENAVGHVPL